MSDELTTIPNSHADSGNAGTSDATAIPKASGNATNDTLIAAEKSLRKFSLRPLKPEAGIVFLVFMVLIKRSIYVFQKNEIY